MNPNDPQTLRTLCDEQAKTIRRQAAEIADKNTALETLAEVYGQTAGDFRTLIDGKCVALKPYLDRIEKLRADLAEAQADLAEASRQVEATTKDLTTAKAQVERLRRVIEKITDLGIYPQEVVTKTGRHQRTPWEDGWNAHGTKALDVLIAELGEEADTAPSGEGAEEPWRYHAGHAPKPPSGCFAEIVTAIKEQLEKSQMWEAHYKTYPQGETAHNFFAGEARAFADCLDLIRRLAGPSGWQPLPPAPKEGESS